MSRRSPEGLREVIRDYRREQIIDVARRLFGDRGTTDVSMDEIAAEAGVARSTIYVYFANRDELLRACLQRMYRMLQDALVGEWERASEPGERLRAIIFGLLERVDESPAFFRLAVALQSSAASEGLAIGNELTLIGLDVARILEDLVDEGTTMGVFRAVAPTRAASLIGQLLYGTMCVRAADPNALSLEEEVDDLCSFILHSLAKRSGDVTSGTGGGLRPTSGTDDGRPASVSEEGSRA